ncbi:MAG: RCC1 repeat-containing protein [Betaproteobacteria bacterium]|nr:MAG: RCC1 repeat-containing protein [Betaproteobacteria bacterium]
MFNRPSENRVCGKHIVSRALRSTWRVAGVAFTLLVASTPAAFAAGAPPSISRLDDAASQVVSGQRHSCAINAAGGVLCWGNNTFGELGDGTGINRRTPVPVVGLQSRAVMLSAGAASTCAVLVTGTVKCWGSNGAGQLGDATTVDRLAPVTVSGIAADSVVSVALGTAHACALLTSGAAKCWGDNTSAQLGIGAASVFTPFSPMPMDVLGLSGSAVSLAAGYGHTCAQMKSGAVRCWGWNASGQLGDGSFDLASTPRAVVGLPGNATSLTTNHNATCVVAAKNGVYCWGETAYDRPPGQERTNLPRVVPALASGVLRVVVGGFSANHFCAKLLPNDSVQRSDYCWGSNNYSELAVDSTDAVVRTPQPVTRLDGWPSQYISHGQHHACALSTRGEIRCWGFDGAGALGRAQVSGAAAPLPRGVAGFTHGVSAVFTGEAHTCATTPYGAAYCWGGNALGALGDGTQISRSTPVAVQALSFSVSTMALGQHHSCAVEVSANEDENVVKCWGGNTHGQLGDGSNTLRTRAVVAISSGETVALAVGANHTCALSSDGAVMCWGHNGFGQLGDGTTTDQNTPTPVVGLSTGVIAIGAGRFHTCAILTGGAAQCWGYNDDGQLGDGTKVMRLQPTPVQTLGNGVIAVSGGIAHTCAVLDTGATQCWGGNFYRQLGHGASVVESLVPLQVPGLTSGGRSVSAGLFHTCASDGNGVNQCWGYNGEGQMGNDTIGGVSQALVTPLGFGSNTSRLSTRGSHVCVLEQGAFGCWGQNTAGQLGRSTATGPIATVTETRVVEPLFVFAPRVLVVGAPATEVNAIGYASLSTTNLSATYATLATCSGASTATINAVPNRAPAFRGIAAGLCGVLVDRDPIAPYAPTPPIYSVIPVLADAPLNVDNSTGASQYAADSDAIIMLRYLFGIRGAALTRGVTSISPQRSPAQIEVHLRDNLPLFDVDGDNQTLALTDGLMILRRLLGLNDEALVTGTGNEEGFRIGFVIDALRP